MACHSVCTDRRSIRVAVIWPSSGAFHRRRGVDRAIKVAQTLGIPLKIAAKVDRTDEVYFHEKINPLLKEPGVQFIGEIDEQQKSDFLGQASALMFLIDWPEPFGLSMIEAMACGTPVLALRRGSVEEVVEDGLTGHIVDSIEEAAVALPRVMPCAGDLKSASRPSAWRAIICGCTRHYLNGRMRN